MIGHKKLIVDLFAGGGGASLGIEMALGRSPDIAVNHDDEALAMHRANHPDTLHLHADVWHVNPMKWINSREVGLLWASPDCKHFSKAKGGRPVKRAIRDLAWVVVRWAKHVKPDVIALENVEEFRFWCPLISKIGPDGEPILDVSGSPYLVPDPARKGETFMRWVGRLRAEGYRVEWRERRACNAGAPTIRKRLFVIARRDGKPIVWPAPTHAERKSDDVKSGRCLPWRVAADIIDWSLPCPSIFLTKQEARAIGCKRPLADATMARIAKGVFRYVINCAEPFIVPITHSGDSRVHSVHDPLRTITSARRGEHALVTPIIAGVGSRAAQSGGKPSAGRSAGAPLGTLTATKRGQHAVVTPFLVPRYGERDGQEPRTRPVTEPMPVVVPTGNEASIVVPHLMTMRNAQKPHNGAGEPVHTITAGGAHLHLVSAFLAKHFGDTGQRPGSPCDEPVSTITAADHNAVVSAGLVSLKGSERRGSSIEDPVPSITAQGGHVAEARAFLMKYHRDGGQHADCGDPMPTVDCNDRAALVEALAVTPPFGPQHWERARRVADFLRAHGYWDDREFVTIEVAGITVVVVDIGMRMLTARERFAAQGFPSSYKIDVEVEKETKRGYVRKRISGEAQGRLVGNSVSPLEACALIAANCPELAVAGHQAVGAVA